MSLSQRRPLLLLVTVFALAVAACSVAVDGDDSDTAAGDDMQSVAPSTNVEMSLSFLEEVRRTHADYEVADSPADLAQQAELIVSGRIVGAQPGQLYATLPGERPGIATTVVAIEVKEVVARKSADVVAGDTIYMEIAHPAFVGTATGEPETESEQVSLEPYDVAAFAATVPRVEGVFFLDDRTDEPYWETILDAGAGRPSGAPIYAAYRQGFLIDDPASGLTSVYERLDEMPTAWRALRSLEAVIQGVRGG